MRCNYMSLLVVTEKIRVRRISLLIAAGCIRSITQKQRAFMEQRSGFSSEIPLRIA